MAEYDVTWRVQISADSPEEAAKIAQEYQRDPDSLATVFDVQDEHGNRTICFFHQA